MTIEIKKEIYSDLKKICEKFGINRIINEEKREEILGEQYKNSEFPIVFYNTYIENADSHIIDYENNLYRYDEEIQILLTLESREKTNIFNILYLFLSNTKATNEFFQERKHKRKIRKVYKIQETPFNFKGRRYYKQVLQFSYFAEQLVNFKEEKWR